MATQMMLIVATLCVVPVIGKVVRVLFQLIVELIISAFVIMFFLLVLMTIISHTSIGLHVQATYGTPQRSAHGSMIIPRPNQLA